MGSKKKKTEPKLATVHNITDAIKQQDALVAAPKVQAGQFGAAPVGASAPMPVTVTASNEPPKRRKGLARTHHLDEATRVSKAYLTINHQRNSLLALDGYNLRLRKTAAAQHAANAFAKDSIESQIIPHAIYAHALQMTVARCMDYKVTSEEAADLIRAAIDKKVAEVNCPS